MAKHKKPLITANTIRTLLRTRYSGDEWFLRFEVPNAAGHGGTGYADAVAMNMWPSRGLTIHGFEIKVSRSDWLSELQMPEKSEKFFHHVDRWWLVAPKHIIQEGELPEQWGFIAATPKTLRMVKNAPVIKHDSKLMDRHFVSAIFRHPDIGSSSHMEEVENAIKNTTAQLEKDFERRKKSLQRSYDRLLEWRKDFEESIGMDYTEYKDPKLTGDHLKAAMGFLSNVSDYSLNGLENRTKSILRSIEKIREELKHEQAVEGDSGHPRSPPCRWRR